MNISNSSTKQKKKHAELTFDIDRIVKYPTYPIRILSYNSINMI